MMTLKNLLLVCGIAGTMVACGTATTTDGAKTEGKAATGSEVKSGPIAGGETAAAGGLSHTVYFDFDSSSYHPEDRNTIIGQSKLLLTNRGKKVTLEGHCDERGTTEYNMALGLRRAKAVKEAMVAQGVKGDQVKTVTYGKSRPAQEGHDEAAWRLNRRVEFVSQ